MRSFLESVGVTGGMGSGKSTFAGMLADKLGGGFFCADRAVREMLEEDGEVVDEIRREIGNEFISGGRVDRRALRGKVFEDEGLRRKLEGILHPRVWMRYEHFLQECESLGQFVVAEVPLLFEAGWEHRFGVTICVSCSEQVVWERLKRREGFEEEVIKKMIASQLPLFRKEELSHHVVWNDGTLRALEAQAGILALKFRDV